MPALAGIRYVRAPMIASSRRLPLVLFVLAACGANSASMPAATTAAVRADDCYRVLAENWAFAGWRSCWQQLRETTGLEVVGDEAAWQQFASERAIGHDAAALALARELVAPDRAEAFASFAASPAGQALALAEGRAHALGWNMLEVPTGTLVTFRNRAEVGETARMHVLELVELFRDKTRSVSPAALAVTIAAIAITPEQADAIDAFHRTDDGAAWLAVRDEARKRTRERVVAVQGDALERGLVKDRFNIPTLPKAQFAEPESPR